MAIRYQSTEIAPLRSDSGNRYYIYIHDVDYVGDPVEFNTESPGFTVEYFGENNDVKGGLIPSSCEVTMLVELATATAQETLMQDIATSEEGRFLLEITKKPNAGTESLWWCGIITPDVSSVEDFVHPYVFSINAVDGLARLKDTEYKDGTMPHGWQSFMYHLINSLKGDPFMSDNFFSGSDIFLRTVTNWYESGMGAVTAAKEPLIYSRIDDEACFHKRVNSYQWEFASCYDVLEKIAFHWRARLYFAEGCWRFEQLNERRSATFTERRFDVDGAYLSNATTQYDKAITNNNPLGTKLSYPTFTWLPALYEVWLNYKHNTYTNFAVNTSFRWGTTGSNDAYELLTTSFKADSFLRISGTIRYKITGPTGASAIPFRHIFKMAAYDADAPKYLRRLTSVPSNTYIIIYDTPTWESSGEFGVDISSDFFFDPGTLQKVGEIKFAFETPVIPIGVSKIVVDFMENISVDKDGATVATTVNEWAVKDLIISVEGEESEGEKEADRIVINTNTDLTNGKRLKYDFIFGTPVNPWTPRRIQTSSDLTTWANSGILWGVGGSEGLTFEFLFARETIAAQKTAIRRYRARFAGNSNITVHRRYQLSDGFNYLFMGGRFSCEDEMIDGEFWEVKHSPTGIGHGVIKSPIQVPIFPIGGELTSSTPGIYVPGASTNKQQDSGSNVALAALTTNFVDTALAAGAQTSIDFALPAKANSYLVGDEIMLLNPQTGTLNYLTVTAANDEGDTTLSVSGTTDVDFPKGSMVLYSVLNKFTQNGSNDASVLPPLGTALQYLRINAAGDELEWATLTLPSGTVTSVGLSLPSIFSVSGSPVTSSGTLTGTLATQAANAAFIGPTTGGAAIPTFRALVAADIPSLLVSKLLQSGATPGQYLSWSGSAWAPVTLSAITGTLTATRIPFASSAIALSDDTNLEWDNTNKGLIVGDATSTTSGRGRITVETTATTDQTLIYASAAATAIREKLFNSRNFGNSGNAVKHIIVGGGSGGDPYILYEINGIVEVAAGLDNSDGDRYKLSRSTSIGTNDFLVIDPATGFAAIGAVGIALLTNVNFAIFGTGGVRLPAGINAQRPSQSYVFRANTEFQGVEFRDDYGLWHRLTDAGFGAAPSLTAGSGSGVSPTLNSVGTDMGGVISLLTGSSPAAAGADILTLTYGQSFSAQPFVGLTAHSANFYTAGFYVHTYGNGSFVLRAANTLTAATTYKIGYQIQN